MPEKRWRLCKPETETVEKLKNALNVSDPIARVLTLRGIDNFEKANNYFNPSLDNLYDPFLMDGMEKSIDRILKAIGDNERICVYGDYDVDGTCSTSILYLFLKEIKADAVYYIPNRITEGYGISDAGLDNVKALGAKVVVSVDCGITAIEPAEYAKNIGLDLIITDHHHPKETLPDAFSVIDPLKPGCNYPVKILSGAGIAFKLVDAICRKKSLGNLHYKYLDLAAIAAAADIVPLVDENRIIVREGIRQINTQPRPGIKALLESSKLSKNGETKSDLNSSQIVFILAPRINAVGRLGSAQKAVELLTAEDINKAKEIAKILEEQNTLRRDEDSKTLEAAEQLVKDEIDFDKERSIVLHNHNWHQGVVGIVASRLVEKFHRPTVMLTTVDGKAKGSARSIPNFNIYNALKECEDLLIHFGGHQAAAGLAIELPNISKFKYRFNEIVNSTILEEDLIPEITIDSDLDFSKITPQFLNVLGRMQPYGPGNMKPIFCTHNAVVVSSPRWYKGENISFNLRQSNTVMCCTGWKMKKEVKLLKQNSIIDIIFTIENSRDRLKLSIKDLKIIN